MSATQPSRRHEELERHSSNALERISSNAPELDAFAAAVAAHLAAAMPAPAPARDPEALLEARAAAELLAVPPSWLRAEARAGRVPHRRFGKYVRFDRVELLESGGSAGARPAHGTSRRLSAYMHHAAVDEAAWIGALRRARLTPEYQSEYQPARLVCAREHPERTQEAP